MRVSSTPVPMVTVVRPSSRCSREDSRSTLRTRSSGAVTTVRRSSPRRTCSWVSVRRKYVVSQGSAPSPSAPRTMNGSSQVPKPPSEVRMPTSAMMNGIANWRTTRVGPTSSIRASSRSQSVMWRRRRCGR